MQAFQMAAKRQVDREDGDDELEVQEYPLEFKIGEYELNAKPPTPAQVSLLIGTGALGGGASLGATYRFLRGTLDRRSYNVILTLIEEGLIDDDILIGGNEDNDKGIVNWLIEEVAERPTRPQSTSSSSSPAGGKKSTGRSPGKGSTLSE